MIHLRLSRYILGWVILLSHFSAVILYFVYGVVYYRPAPLPDTLQGVLTISPLAAVYVVVFIRYASMRDSDIDDEEGVKVRLSAFFVQAFVIILFGICLIGGMIFLFQTGSLPRDQIPLFTGALDTVFGIYLATIFSRLFPAAAFVSDNRAIRLVSTELTRDPLRADSVSVPPIPPVNN